jgi:hypothetical protein
MANTATQEKSPSATPATVQAKVVTQAEFEAVIKKHGDVGKDEAKQKALAKDLIALFGNKSSAIRGMAGFGLKAGPISRALGIIYQHARNVLSRPLKREIKEQRETAAKAAPAGTTTAKK